MSRAIRRCDVEGPHPDDQQPRQGALPAHRHHQGRGAQLLRARRRRRAAAAPHGPRGDPDPLAARRRGQQLLREEQAGRHAVVGAHGRACPTTGPAEPARRATGDTLDFPICDDLATLTWLANLAALELHVHQWTVTRRVARAGRTGSSSTSTPASRRACTSAAGWRCWCATRWPSATWRAARSPAAARACTCTPPCRRAAGASTATAPRRWPRRWPRSCSGAPRRW